MNENNLSSLEKETRFKQFIVREYLKYGSVDEVFRHNDYDLPVSYPEVHRIVKGWGIIKSTGPSSILSEALTFFTLLSQTQSSMESLYKKLPPSFKTSMSTMHRLLHNIKEGVIRRVGTALIIAPEDNPYLVLVGEDISTPRIELGKPYGSTTLPMGYSRQDEDSRSSVLRILQREVFTESTIDKTLPEDIIPANPKPISFVDIVDIRVAVYGLSFPRQILEKHPLSSYKVQNHKFVSALDLTHKGYNYRAGIREIGIGYLNYLDGSKTGSFLAPAVACSLVNKALSA
ncbi:hypothetical protein ACFL1Q_01510 [Patescibacteria group bacterium]